jgi:hypothetical protein
MNRATRLSLIAVMLLSTSMLGILGWNAMHPAQPEPKQEPTKQEQPAPAQPRSNPEFEKLQADLVAHERHCVQLAKQATILVSQGQSQAKQRVEECRTLVEIERKYVENFPAKTIQ